MTSRTLRKHILVVILFLVSYGGIGVFLWREHPHAYGLYKDLIPLALAVPIALLSWSFQRRMSYLQALRDFWQRLIPAVQGAIQYTYLSNPGQADFARTLEHLATVMDLARGVFANVPAKGSRNGLYPYENLKDIYNTISWLALSRSDRSFKCAAMCHTSLARDV
jgi:hypothetical protein